jgi:hypothetical protein
LEANQLEVEQADCSSCYSAKVKNDQQEDCDGPAAQCSRKRQLAYRRVYECSRGAVYDIVNEAISLSG